MTTKEIDDLAWRHFPFTWKNNRGIFLKEYTDKAGKRHKYYVRCGIPEPKNDKEKDNLKGGDRIGYHITEVTADMIGRQVAIFTNLEIKGPGDILHPGQIAWHNNIICHGGISEIWTDSEIIREIIE